MTHKFRIRSSVFFAAGLLLTSTGHALDFGNIMNPSRWMGGDRGGWDNNYYDGYGPAYGPGPYGPGYGGPGYGYGAPGYGYGAPGYGYGAPGYGYPAPGYGAPAYGYGAPGYAYGAPANAPAPSQPDSGTAAEIKQLQERIRKLEEEARRAPATGPGQSWRGVTQPSYPRTPPSAPEQTWGDAPSGYEYRP